MVEANDESGSAPEPTIPGAHLCSAKPMNTVPANRFITIRARCARMSQLPIKPAAQAIAPKTIRAANLITSFPTAGKPHLRLVYNRGDVASAKLSYPAVDHRGDRCLAGIAPPRLVFSDPAAARNTPLCHAARSFAYASPTGNARAACGVPQPPLGRSTGTAQRSRDTAAQSAAPEACGDFARAAADTALDDCGKR